MENSPLSNQVDVRLKQLDREIHSSLKMIRKHLQELEEVEERTRSGSAASRTFSDFLSDALTQEDGSGRS